ncbi:MAG: FKBP-type peptidyl-prolyl cis-trans isomerase [Bacteroidetes bacterium]|nr:FKBP-type peptidyl-prolyl cis-trans isomerase [Bacteroidota bacterium]
MRHIVLFLFLVLICSFNTGAQCEKCQMLPTENFHFCFTDDDFDGICAQFGVDQNNFRIQSGKKPREIPLSDPDGMVYLISISNEPKLKITPYEILFIQRALEAWKIEQRKYGHSYTQSGLGYRIIEEGTGEKPVNGEVINVHYTGYLEDGSKFDSSYDRDKPFSFTLGEGKVIKGWDEGLSLLNKGSRAILRIPPNLGYGARSVGSIPVNSTLYFEIELLEKE